MSLTNTQYDEIMRAYQEKQLARHRLIAAREEEVAQRSPRFSDVNAEIAHLCVQEASQRLRVGESSSAESVRDRVAALTDEKREILVSMGYPADYLDPPYVCPDCRDTGYIGTERCHCFRQAAIDLVYGQSHLSPVFERECFDRFSLDYYPRDQFDEIVDISISAYEAAEHTLRRCRQFADDFDSKYENLLLFGGVGVGKTFLCNCIAGELIRTGHSVIYFSAVRLFDALADHAFAHDPGEDRDYRSIFDCDLLIIDDLGTEMTNSLTLSQFFDCLNDRVLHERSTLISSNLDLKELSTIYSERIISRITRLFELLHLFGKDIRVAQTI